MAAGRLMAVVVMAAALGAGPLAAGQRLKLHRPHIPLRGYVLPPTPLPTPLFNPESYGIPPEEFALPPPSPAPAAPPLAPAPPMSFSEGMAITIEKTLREGGREDDGGARSSPLIERPKQAAEQLAACWSPPLPGQGETVEITIRFAFNGQGGVMGSPRITYVKAGKGMSAEDVRQSIRTAIKDCTPMRFSKSMAASAPGYPLAVRFVGKRAEDSTGKN